MKEIPLSVEQIMDALPHRYPMLLVDRVLEVEIGKSCRGLKNVTINEPFFTGHYPGKPVMPGVLILEAMAQSAAILLLHSPDNQGKIPLIGAIEKAKFRKPVVPGDQLIMDSELLWMRGAYGCFKSVATVDGSEVASMEMTFALIDP